MRRFDPSRFTPLTAALLIPAVLAVVLAGIWLASHAKGTAPGVAGGTPAASAAPTAEALPSVWPPESGGFTEPPRAYGRITLAPAAPGQHVTATLAGNATVPPARIAGTLASVERVAPPPPSAVSDVAARLAPGAHASTDQSVTVWANGALLYDAGRTFFTWTALTGDTRLPLVPRDDATAANAALGWLVYQGFVDRLTPAVARQVSRGDRAAFATWTVRVPHVGGQSTATAISMEVSASGLVTHLDITHPVVVAKSAYPLADWHDAWAHLQAGTAYALSPAATAAHAIPLQVDSVQLTAHVTRTDRGLMVIPMYAFADSSTGTTAYWPALAAADYTLP